MVSEAFLIPVLNALRYLLLLIILVVFIIITINFFKSITKTKNETQEPNNDVLDLNYVATPLLSQNEKYAFKNIHAFCKEHDLLAFVKVRLIDLVQPKKGAADYAILRNKVIQKHVDFVICDEDVNVKLIIELDDSSHSRPDRRERDQLVDEVLHRVGYKVIHTNGITPELLSKELFPVELDPETKE